MKKFDNSVLITLIVVAGILALSLMIFIFANSTIYSKTVTSTGTASIKVSPDLIAVYFNVQTDGLTGKEASEKNSEIVEKMTSAFLDLGFDESEIQTQDFSVYPKYEWVNNKYESNGYTVSHSIKIEILIDEKKKIGGVLDAGIKAGAGISYINYEITKENQEKYKSEAIKTATENAKTKAEAIASGAGQKLGRLVSVASSDFGYVPWLAVSEADAKAGSSEIVNQINPSSQEVTASVTAVFKLSGF